MFDSNKPGGPPYTKLTAAEEYRDRVVSWINAAPSKRERYARKKQVYQTLYGIGDKSIADLIKEEADASKG